MKRLLGYSIIIIFVAFTIFLLANANHQNFDITYVDRLEDSYEETLKICVKREDGKFVLIDVEKHNNENLYLYILKLYDHYRNHLPLSYTTPLSGNFEVINLKKTNDVINMELDILYLDSGLMDFLNALMWSYQDLGINKMVVKINNEVITLNKDANINLIVESNNLYSSTKQIIYYEEEEAVVPVTYLHNENKIDFIFKKIISKFNISYNYEIFDNTIIVNIKDEENLLSETMYKLIIMNLENLEDYDNIIIIVNDKEIYNN